MARFTCTCSKKFRKKKDAESHLEAASVKFDGEYHYVIEKRIFERIYDYCSRHNIGRFIGGMILYIVLTNHFKIEFSVWEGCFIGAGIALLLD